MKIYFSINQLKNEISEKIDENEKNNSQKVYITIKDGVWVIDQWFIQ